MSPHVLTCLPTCAPAPARQLEDLWLNDNQLPAIDAALDRALEPVRATLSCIYLEGNPLVRSDGGRALGRGMRVVCRTQGVTVRVPS